jgi:hypothetical protein
MPRKFPPITALEWSPLHNLKSLKRKMREEREREKQVSSPMEGKLLLLFPAQKGSNCAKSS